MSCDEFILNCTLHASQNVEICKAFLQRNKDLSLPIGPHLFFFSPSGLTSCTEFWLFPSRIGERPSRVWVQSSRREGIQHGLIYPSTS